MNPKPVPDQIAVVGGDLFSVAVYSSDLAAIVRKGVARITKSRFLAPWARKKASKKVFENDFSPFDALSGARSGPKFYFSIFCHF